MRSWPISRMSMAVVLVGVAVTALYATRLGFAPIYLIHDEVNVSLQAASVAKTGWPMAWCRIER